MPKTAVCVGINDYPDGVGDLRGCVNDADDWASLLTAQGLIPSRSSRTRAQLRPP